MLDTIFLTTAVVGCTVLVCQFTLGLFGLGHDSVDVSHDAGGDFSGHVGGDFHGDAAEHFGGHDAVHDSDAAQHAHSNWLFGMLSFRTLVAALAFFGVAGEAARSAGYSASTSFVLALAAGYSAMYGTYRLMRFIAGLTSSGNELIRNAVGRPATVYVPIPADGKGAGKVQLSMQNRIVEYQAVTDDAEPLKTGQSVQVIGVAGGDVVHVRRATHTGPVPVVAGSK